MRSAVWKEAVAVGLLIVLAGNACGYAISKLHHFDNYVIPMNLALFASGAILHVTLEAMGANREFCNVYK